MSNPGVNQPIRFKRLDPRAVLPTKAHPTDAGWDLTSLGRHYLSEHPVKVRTGLAAELPGGTFALIMPRSGLASKGVMVLGGVIDNSYRGEWIVLLACTGNESVVIEPGDRVAQFTILHTTQMELIEVAELGETERGSGGLGSTGR